MVEVQALKQDLPFNTDRHQIEHSGHGRDHLHIGDRLAYGTQPAPSDHEVLERLEWHEDEQQEQIGDGQADQEDGGGRAELAVHGPSGYDHTIAYDTDQEGQRVRYDDGREGQDSVEEEEEK